MGLSTQRVGHFTRSERRLEEQGWPGNGGRRYQGECGSNSSLNPYSLGGRSCCTPVHVLVPCHQAAARLVCSPSTRTACLLVSSLFSFEGFYMFQTLFLYRISGLHIFSQCKADTQRDTDVLVNVYEDFATSIDALGTVRGRHGEYLKSF